MNVMLSDVSCKMEESWVRTKHEGQQTKPTPNFAEEWNMGGVLEATIVLGNTSLLSGSTNDESIKEITEGDPKTYLTHDSMDVEVDIVVHNEKIFAQE